MIYLNFEILKSAMLKTQLWEPYGNKSIISFIFLSFFQRRRLQYDYRNANEPK